MVVEYRCPAKHRNDKFQQTGRAARMKPGQFRMFRSSIAGIEAVAAETGHSFPRHTHDQFGIGVIERGAQNIAERAWRSVGRGRRHHHP